MDSTHGFLVITDKNDNTEIVLFEKIKDKQNKIVLAPGYTLEKPAVVPSRITIRVLGVYMDIVSFEVENQEGPTEEITVGFPDLFEAFYSVPIERLEHHIATTVYFRYRQDSMKEIPNYSRRSRRNPTTETYSKFHSYEEYKAALDAAGLKTSSEEDVYKPGVIKGKDVVITDTTDDITEKEDISYSEFKVEFEKAKEETYKNLSTTFEQRLIYGTSDFNIGSDPTGDNEG